MTINHPPNRFDFVINGGLGRVVRALQTQGSDADIQIQGLGLILNMFVEDPHALYKIPQARQNALGEGLGVLLQDNVANFKSNSKVAALCIKLQNALISDYS
jgi:hypothetical protein